MVLVSDESPGADLVRHDSEYILFSQHLEGALHIVERVSEKLCERRVLSCRREEPMEEPRLERAVFAAVAELDVDDLPGDAVSEPALRAMKFVFPDIRDSAGQAAAQLKSEEGIVCKRVD